MSTGLWLLLLLACAMPAGARGAIFVQGIAAGDEFASAAPTDMVQISGYPDEGGPPVKLELYNRGASEFINLGAYHGQVSRVLLRFPVETLASPNTRITRARLVLTLHYYVLLDFAHPNLPIPLTLELHRILPANADWKEGSSISPEEIPGAVCWAWRKHATAAWAGERGCGRAGTDYQATAISTATLAKGDWPTGQQLIFEIADTAAIEAWIRNPAQNAGLLLRSSALEALPQDDGVFLRLFSDDTANPLYRPRLEIEYEDLPREPLAAAPFQAGIAAVNPNPAYDTMATSLYSGDTHARGGGAELRAGKENSGARWRSVFNFGLTALASRADDVRAFRLTLTCRANPDAEQPAPAFHLLQLDRITPANAGWRESTAVDAGEAGTATWGWLAHGGRAWAGGAPAGAGLQVAGIDYAEPPLATRLVVPGELRDGDPVTFEFACTAALREWIATPAKNAGLRLSCPSLEGDGGPGVLCFDSDDASQKARRPRLEVIYSTAPRPSAAGVEWMRAGQ